VFARLAQVVAVGEQSATFGVPGVSDYCFFMKASLAQGSIRV